MIEARRRRFAPRSDVALAACVVAMVAMMIVPLPTLLLDLCIALNLTLGVLLVSTALYVGDPLRFAAFPTLLLLTTLYRLALNVSSTRLILLQADAGEVIAAFGEFVVHGNYLVGALVFVILTLIQFIVIARGAERVAEVGARFSLDAMPGKQMAIDSELRAGSLTTEGARAQRRRLERESQLYGAMDGAMKFVKGDAVAGIVITLINVLGGVTLGVVGRDLDVEASLRIYGLLAIGDGLVSQIPALLGATAAGLVVTRVASDEQEGSLGREIAAQLFGDVRVLSVGAAVLGVLALVPGLPAFPFGFATLVCAGFWVRARRRQRVHSAPKSRAHSPTLEALALELSPDLGEQLARGGRVQGALDETLTHTRESLEEELGFPFPEAGVRLRQALPARSFRWIWRELPEPTHTLAADAQVLPAIESALRALAKRRAADCLGLEEVQAMLAALERHKPALIRHLMPRLPAPLLAQVLRLLAREGVSLRWLSEILEAIAPHATNSPRASALAEHARRALGPRIAQALAPDGTLRVLRLAPEVEEAISDGLREDGEEPWLALPPDLIEDIVQAITEAHARLHEPHALLTQAALRRHVHTLLYDSLPELAVVAPEELPPALRLVSGEPIGA